MDGDRPDRPEGNKNPKAFIAITFAGIFAFMGFGIFSHIAGRGIDNRDDVLIAEGIDPNDPQYQVIIYSTKSEVRDYILSEVESGADGGIYVDVIDSITEDDIREICKDIDPFYGTVKDYVFSTSSQRDGDGPEIKDRDMGASIGFVRSDEIYVYENIINGTEIPSDRPEAAELKVFCEDFLKNNIKEGMSDYDIELAIHDYIVNECEYYEGDEFPDHTKKAYGALIKHEAICEGYSRAAALLLKLCGIDARLVKGNANYDITPDYDKEVYNHMWVQVYINNSWYNLDPTWDDPTGNSPVISHFYFNVPDKILEENHFWNRDRYKKCTSMGMNYFKHNNLVFDNQDAFQDYVSKEIDSGSSMIECGIKDIDTGQEAMYFVFDHEGIENYVIYKEKSDEYEVVRLIFNEKD